MGRLPFLRPALCGGRKMATFRRLSIIMTSHLPDNISRLQSLARLVRYHCLNMTSTAHSGHLTSSLSAADLMAGLLFGGTFRFKVAHPDYPNNDRLIFSKG